MQTFESKLTNIFKLWNKPPKNHFKTHPLFIQNWKHRMPDCSSQMTHLASSHEKKDGKLQNGQLGKLKNSFWISKTNLCWPEFFGLPSKFGTGEFQSGRLILVNWVGFNVLPTDPPFTNRPSLGNGPFKRCVSSYAIAYMPRCINAQDGQRWIMIIRVFYENAFWNPNFWSKV